MVEASNEKEARAKEAIQQLKIEITNLTKMIEQGAGLSVGQEKTVNDLVQVYIQSHKRPKKSSPGKEMHN